MARRGAVELILGLLAGVAGFLAAGSVLFQPTTNLSCVRGVCTTTSGPAIALTSPINAVMSVLLLSVAPLLVAGGAIWHSRTGVMGGRIFVLIGTALTFFPAAAFALFGSPLTRILALLWFLLAVLTTIVSFVGSRQPSAATS
jgi:hypothetical protein